MNAWDHLMIKSVAPEGSDAWTHFQSVGQGGPLNRVPYSMTLLQVDASLDDQVSFTFEENDYTAEIDYNEDIMAKAELVTTAGLEYGEETSVSLEGSNYASDTDSNEGIIANIDCL